MATLLEQVEIDTELRSATTGRNPWALAARRLWRNRIAMAAPALFVLVVALCRWAPCWAVPGGRLGSPGWAAWGPCLGGAGGGVGRAGAPRLWPPTLGGAGAGRSRGWRPGRGRVLSVGRKEFVEAATARGAGSR